MNIETPNQQVQIDAIREASRSMVRDWGLLQGQFEPVGMSPSECHCLLELRRCGPSRATDLAEILRIDKSTMSRVITALRKRGLCEVEDDGQDRRQKRIRISEAGLAKSQCVDEASDALVAAAIAHLAEEERETVVRGLDLLAKGLSRRRQLLDFIIEPICADDAAAMADIVRVVLTEFDCTGPGYALHDPEMQDLHAAYQGERQRFFVIRHASGVLAGGAGIAPLQGADEDVCELRKCYIKPEFRSRGLGGLLLKKCLEAARSVGFASCYLETTEKMHAAHHLYEKYGFVRREMALGHTGHAGVCAVYFERRL